MINTTGRSPKHKALSTTPMCFTILASAFQANKASQMAWVSGCLNVVAFSQPLVIHYPLNYHT